MGLRLSLTEELLRSRVVGQGLPDRLLDPVVLLLAALQVLLVVVVVGVPSAVTILARHAGVVSIAHRHNSARRM